MKDGSRGMEVACECGGQSWKFTLLERISILPDGERYLARDVSSPHLAMGDPEGGLVHVDLRRIGSSSAKQQYLRDLEQFQRVGAHSHLWKMYAWGVAIAEEFQDCVLTAGEIWSHTLSERLCGGAMDLRESAVIFDQVAQGLFLLHAHGAAHGGVGGECVACCREGAERLWKLQPAPPRKASPGRLSSDKAEDVRALGHLTGRILGIDTTVPDQTWMSSRAIGPDWRAILRGCLSKNAGRRWTAGRAIFGANPPPVAGPLTVIPGPSRYQILWPQAHDVDVDLFELRDRRPFKPGTVRVPDVLDSYGRLWSNGGNSVNILPPFHGHVFQVVSRLRSFAAVVFGGIVRLSVHPEVEGLEVKIDRGRLVASWNWPKGITEVRLGLRRGRFADSPEDADHVFSVAQDAYFLRSSEQMVDLPGEPDDSPLFVTAFAGRTTENGCEFSSGASGGARWRGPGYRHRISYRIETPPKPARSPGIGSRTYELVLSSPTRVRLPQLMLLAARRASDLGTNVAQRIHAIRDGTVLEPAREFRSPFSFVPSDGRSGWSVKLIAAEAQENLRVDLLSEVPEGLRLS